ncbi:Uma2 family endonuclease [Brevundimonas sp. LM2]|uniref:Uma2 family endonuclease n=1 Tax=Brevundimonas sp. LM2 TaxID=1938605 RepID=UPI000986CCA3|nr:Uma2 family endonuclease [Brevundimonas sp. LM2]
MNAALKLMTPDAFLDWCQSQEDRWELVDGMPRMMTGATRRHDRIVVNLIADLHSKLRGKPCQPNTADVAALMLHGNVRRPDVTVDCASAPRQIPEQHGADGLFRSAVALDPHHRPDAQGRGVQADADP